MREWKGARVLRWVCRYGGLAVDAILLAAMTGIVLIYLFDLEW